MNDHQEKILTEALEDLKVKAGAVINGIMGDLYTDYLPHVVTDTESNISYRVEGCIKNILQGKAELLDEKCLIVGDTYGCEHIVSLNGYNTNLEPLANALMPLMGDAILKERISGLESQVQSLKSQLEQAYSYR